MRDLTFQEGLLGFKMIPKTTLYDKTVLEIWTVQYWIVSPLENIKMIYYVIFIKIYSYIIGF